MKRPGADLIKGKLREKGKKKTSKEEKHKQTFSDNLVIFGLEAAAVTS